MKTFLLIYLGIALLALINSMFWELKWIKNHPERKAPSIGVLIESIILTDILWPWGLCMFLRMFLERAIMGKEKFEEKYKRKEEDEDDGPSNGTAK